MIQEDSFQVFHDNSIKISFKYETHYEEDDTWGCLCVSINDGIFRMCQPLFGTEDINKIREYIKQDGA